eukprot:TRINITY_DN640_c0_g1_i1.p1 TRINITY_DN640_c0_g1~~TRINITY_DN640_c0_g1_i1.p1  ORF type:complete len:131 (-),score=51.85 TRINITY_DN640_c0_g1_i1:75-467(-)
MSAHAGPPPVKDFKDQYKEQKKAAKEQMKAQKKEFKAQYKEAKAEAKETKKEAKEFVKEAKRAAKAQVSAQLAGIPPGAPGSTVPGYAHADPHGPQSRSAPVASYAGYRAPTGSPAKSPVAAKAPEKKKK